MIESLDEYQFEAAKTMKPGMSLEDSTKYFCMKLSEEIGEINSLFAKKLYHSKDFTQKQLLDELGDLFWYLANLANSYNFKLSEVATNNYNKLRERHGESYNKDYYIGVTIDR